MNPEQKVLVRWRLDDVPDGIVTWGELCIQRPDIAAGEAAEIVACGFLYEHEDGVTIKLVEET